MSNSKTDPTNLHLLKHSTIFFESSTVVLPTQFFLSDFMFTINCCSGFSNKIADLKYITSGMLVMVLEL